MLLELKVEFMVSNKPIILYGNLNKMRYYLGESYAHIADQATGVDFGKENELNSHIGSNTLLLISWCQFRTNEREILFRAQNAGMAILIIADGILEYRNTWLHPELAPGSIYQPILGHKMACIGHSQARILESWGNIGNCEIVGAPRFDKLLGKRPRKRKKDDPFRILVITAKTPGFTQEQLDLVRLALQDLKLWFSDHKVLNGIRLEVIWRITEGLDKEIGIENQLPNTSFVELSDVLSEVDGVITTPSTSVLEAMLHGLPVALLDYCNCPQYVPAAWNITAPGHIDQVLPELVNSPAPKMLYQDTVLHDALECRTPAAPRMVQLVEEMLRITCESRSKGTPLSFPDHILEDRERGHHMPEEKVDIKALYPGHPVFSEMDRLKLQAEVDHLRRIVDQKTKEINGLTKEINRLIDCENQIQVLKNSLSWRVTAPLRRIFEVLKRN